MAKNNEMDDASRQWALGSQHLAVSSVRCLVSSRQSLICGLSFVLDQLFIAYCLLQTAYCKLFTANCLLLTAYCLLTTACFQPESGCLDIEATNFNIAADEPCEGDDSATSCPCTYPTFSFGSTDYSVDKSAYTADNAYLIDSQYIRIVNIQFYLSDFKFRRISGEWVGVEDTIGLTILNNNGLKDTILTDDFVLVNRQRSISLGAIKQSGEFDSLRFVVGISEPANTVNPDSISSTTHPLAESEMHTGSINDGYIFNQLVIHRDTLSDTESTTLNISENVENGQIVTVQKPISAKSPIGANFSLGTLTINHAKWFDGIKFVTDTDAVMIEKIVANTPNVFSITN